MSKIPYGTTVQKLIEIAEGIARTSHLFFDIKGPGEGDRATHAFMRQLREGVGSIADADCIERRLCGESALAVDFYFEHESTIVEVAFSLRNSMSEFEKDILKAVMAKERGFPVTALVFISKPGAAKRHAQPGSRAIIEWVRRNHDIQVSIHEIIAQAASTFA